jgi:hypothetical protein
MLHAIYRFSHAFRRVRDADGLRLERHDGYRSWDDFINANIADTLAALDARHVDYLIEVTPTSFRETAERIGERSEATICVNFFFPTAADWGSARLAMHDKPGWEW